MGLLRKRLLIIVVLAIVLSSLYARQLQKAPPAAPSLPGIWGTEISFGPRIQGEFTLLQRKDIWTAEASGSSVQAHIKDGEIYAEFPAGAGTFRGRLEKDGSIYGYWIQPASKVNGPKFATPVSLKTVATKVWRGTLAPLDDSFSLYLALTKHDDRLTASFRNPDRNDRGGAPEFAVIQDGKTLRFTDPKNPGNTFTGTFDAEQEKIVVNWRNLGLPLTLTKRTADNAIGYFPRLVKEAYRYQKPQDAGDGWPTDEASAVGFDENALATLVNQIQQTNVSEPTAPLIHSILIARHGKLVLDEYFFGHDKQRPHDLRSGAKTFASVLVGATIQKGYSVNINAPILSYLRSYASISNQDARKREITLNHLMTMSSGLACDENDNNSPGSESALQSQTTQPDWYKFMLDLPMQYRPGEHYAYCSGGVNLIGGVVHSITGRWLVEYFDNTVAKPLDIRHYHMNLTPTGDLYFGGGMRLRSRDYLKFGQLYLDRGTWKGRQIVGPEWVKESTAPQITATPQSSDGFDWHLYQLRAGDRTYREYEANGNGGQFLIVLPELDTAIVFTAGNYNMYGVWRKFRDELVPQSIIAAIRRS